MARHHGWTESRHSQIFSRTSLAASAFIGVCSLLSPIVAAEANHLRPPSEEAARDARHRIALADEKRALTEEISEVACLIALGVGRETYGPLIHKLTDEFEAIGGALRYGDEALGVTGEEHSSKVLRALMSIDALWPAFREAAETVVATGVVDEATGEALFEADAALLDEIALLIVGIETAYANPNEMMLGDAMTIDIAGRQEMLTQAIGKDVCLVKLDWRRAKHQESLARSLQIFEASHDALTNGMPAAGVKPAPTPEIREALDAVMAKWKTQRPVIDAALAGEVADEATLKAFIDANISLLDDLRAVVALYEAL